MGVNLSPPKASTTVAGQVELATLAEVTTGTDTARAVTPAGVKQEIDALDVVAATLPLAIDNTTDVDVANVTAFTVPYLASAQGAGTVLTTSTSEALISASAMTIPANTLSAGDRITLVAWGSRLDNAGGDTTLRIRVGGLAGTSLGSIILPNATIATSATVRPWRWTADLVMINDGSNKTSQSGLVTVAGASTTTTDIYSRSYQATSAALTLSSSQDWVLTAIHSTSSANLWIGVTGLSWDVTIHRP